MLTSKDILESTGISRATLNNYISAGLIARPDVLPPGPEHAGAPRIGYFPDDTIDRIRTIQRLKAQGWSMSRIGEHFQRPGSDGVPEPTPARAILPAAHAAVATPSLQLHLHEAGHPAYLVDERFVLVWRNPAAQASASSPVAGLAIGASVLGHLLTGNGPGSHALLRFHLAVGRDRGSDPALWAAAVDHGLAARLARMVEEVRSAGAMPVAHVSLAAGGGLPLRLGFAVHFREHVLFAFSPASASAAPASTRAPASAPALESVAVLYATLHDASGLWSRLSAQEYFELANEVWAELEAVLRRQRAVTGRHPGEGIVGYFLSEGDDGHLVAALSTARAVKEAMGSINRRWQERKRWDLDIAMDIGIDEGEEWIGALGPDEMRVLGEAAERADQLSRCGRPGTILVTRSFIGKLPAAGRDGLAYAAPIPEGSRSPAMHTFAPLSTVCPTVPARFAAVPVAEVLDPPARGA